MLVSHIDSWLNPNTVQIRQIPPSQEGGHGGTGPTKGGGQEVVQSPPSPLGGWGCEGIFGELTVLTEPYWVKPALTVIFGNTIAYFRVTKTQSSAVLTTSAFCKPKCFKTGFSNRK